MHSIFSKKSKLLIINKLNYMNCIQNYKIMI